MYFHFNFVVSFRVVSRVDRLVCGFSPFSTVGLSNELLVRFVERKQRGPQRPCSTGHQRQALFVPSGHARGLRSNRPFLLFPLKVVESSAHGTGRRVCFQVRSSVDVKSLVLLFSLFLSQSQSFLCYVHRAKARKIKARLASFFSQRSNKGASKVC